MLKKKIAKIISEVWLLVQGLECKNQSNYNKKVLICNKKKRVTGLYVYKKKIMLCCMALNVKKCFFFVVRRFMHLHGGV